jgi:hypothetical protein
MSPEWEGGCVFQKRDVPSLSLVDVVVVGAASAVGAVGAVGAAAAARALPFEARLVQP